MLGPQAFFAGATAAIIHGIPLPYLHHSNVEGPPWGAPAEPLDLIVGVHKPRGATRRRGTRGVRLDASLAPVVLVDGMRVMDMPSTWAMLGATLDERDLVVAADHLIRIPRNPGNFTPPDRGPYSTRAELAAAIRRRRGAEVLRSALGRARTGAASPRESLLRLILVDDGLPEPVLDHDVYDEHGRFLGCLDLAYPELKIGIEHDGSVHREQRQFERDVARLEQLAEADWLILRFTARDMRGTEVAITQRVRRARARRGVAT